MHGKSSVSNHCKVDYINTLHIMASKEILPGSKVSRASWLRSESVSVREDEEEVIFPSAILCGGGPEGRSRGEVLVDMGGR